MGIFVTNAIIDSVPNTHTRTHTFHAYTYEKYTDNPSDIQRNWE